MHGLINRAIECFVRDTYGADTWTQVMERADLGYLTFESMLMYEASDTDTVLSAAVDLLGKSRDDLLEDLGTYLVSHDNTQALRRLLRFGGDDFLAFLHSLDDLPGRARLAVPDLHLPTLELRDLDETTFSLHCGPDLPGYPHVLVGVLRALADDYGALAFLEVTDQDDGGGEVRIILLDEAFAEGRSFELSRRAG